MAEDEVVDAPAVDDVVADETPLDPETACAVDGEACESCQ